MKKIMLSLGIIAIVAVGAVGATRAYFTSTASVTGNTFSSGSMALKIDSDPSSSGQTWVDTFNSGANIAGLYPGYPAKGEHNWQVIDIQNQGDLNGSATIQLNTTSWSALGDNLNFSISYDALNNGTFVPVTSGTLAQFVDQTYNLGTINAGQIASVKIEWAVPTSAGNDIMGKSVVVDGVFGLTQTQ